MVDTSDLNHSNYERIACITFCCICPFFVALRLYARISKNQLGLDDGATVLACLFALANNIQTLVAIEFGWGRHEVNLNDHQIMICLLLHWTFQITYKISVALNKISILLLYHRIMSQRIYRICTYILLSLVGLFAFTTSIAGVFQCIPIQKAWYKSVEGSCYNLEAAWYSNAVFSIVTDIFIIALPTYMVYNLQRDRREKVMLYAMFGMGIFVTFTSIMRFTALKSANSTDPTFDVDSGFWSVIEINVGVICICLPPLRSLLSQFVPFLIGSRHVVAGSGSGYPYVGGKGDASRAGEVPGRSRIAGHHEILDSKEELVFEDPKGGITKSTHITVSETRIENSDDIEMGHWKRDM
ncbi:hypothetical protein BJ878DRAFT_104747 [Calycina marina]|uniref:Rhodopsin domain-containing protein n=1 Tax=Calycina marina TaxID=1763456 RepID=A0A9P7Z2R2_9HELO|nr:hypothetical protein BJ878DRAFT_104747 [Calycina marina]